MTLAGTRPPLISETNLYEPHHKVGDIDNVNLSSVLPEIKMFSNISVREKTLFDLLYSRYNISTALCSDPTIMAGKNIFSSITSDRLIKNKYVFCFLMESKPGIMEVAHKLADERGWEVIDNKSSFSKSLVC